MEQNKQRNIKELIIFTAVVTLAVIHFNSIVVYAGYALSVIVPFVIGGAIAFVLNIPMSSIEKKLFGKAKGKVSKKLARPCSILITFVVFISVVALVCITGIPQIRTAIDKLREQVPIFLENMYAKAEQLANESPYILAELEKIKNNEVSWDQILEMIMSFLGSGVGTTAIVNAFNVAGNIIGGIVNFFIAIVFSIYILASKEKLLNQGKRVLHAFTKGKVTEWAEKIFALLFKNFRNYISGQFLEAIILGLLFLVVLSIGEFPYAVLISTLITLTALIPIVGAFIGCFVGAFLILVDNPMKALVFVIIFLVIQQIEGNLIYPKVVGNSVGLPSMWVLAAVTVGASFSGVLGMLVFIPLTSTAYALLREITNSRNAEKAKAALSKDKDELQSNAEDNAENNAERHVGMGEHRKECPADEECNEKCTEANKKERLVDSEGKV